VLLERGVEREPRLQGRDTASAGERAFDGLERGFDFGRALSPIFPGCA